MKCRQLSGSGRTAAAIHAAKKKGENLSFDSDKRRDATSVDARVPAACIGRLANSGAREESVAARA